MSGTEVITVDAWGLAPPLERSEVSLSQIDNVDIVPDSGSIAGRIVIAEDPEPLKATDRDLRDIGEEVVWDPSWIFPQLAGGVRSNRIKVSEERDAPVRFGPLQVDQDIFDHEL